MGDPIASTGLIFVVTRLQSGQFSMGVEVDLPDLDRDDVWLNRSIR